MSQNENYQAVHWIDGMKLSSNHFIQNDAYHTDQLKGAVALLLNDNNYGLLPSERGGRNSLDYDHHPQADRVEVHLRRCYAVTRGGVRIQYDESIHSPLSASLNSSDYDEQSDQGILLVLTSNPFQRQPSGEPDPEESPLRNPFTLPGFRLEFVNESSLELTHTTEFHLVIGRVEWKEKRFLWDDSYIPPCAVTGVFPALEAKFREFDRLRRNLKRYSTEIITSIHRQEKQNRPEFRRPLALDTASLCGELLRSLADTAFSFRNTALSGPPIQLISQASTLAARLHTSLDILPGDRCEELLNYFYQWMEVQPSQFREAISQVADIHYEHLDIIGSIRPAVKLLTMLEDLWGKLSQLNFIGQEEKNLVMGIESEYNAKNQTQTSLLD